MKYHPFIIHIMLSVHPHQKLLLSIHVTHREVTIKKVCVYLPIRIIKISRALFTKWTAWVCVGGPRCSSHEFAKVLDRVNSAIYRTDCLSVISYYLLPSVKVSSVNFQRRSLTALLYSILRFQLHFTLVSVCHSALPLFTSLFCMNVD